ncbi:MAG: hypothetical protein ACRDY3_00275 [Acidimicrobiales bacterium]
MPDFEDVRNEVLARARDTAFVAVGLGILGIQRAGVQRHHLGKKLAANLDLDRDLDERLAELRAVVAAGAHQVEELFGEAAKLVGDGAGLVGTTLRPIEEQLPGAARDLAGRAFDQARQARDQLMKLVGGSTG